jgi:hypothetical protein
MSDASKLTDERDEGGAREPAEIRADIERTRAELGETAAAVAEKADVKAQATAKVDEVKQQTSDKVQEAKDKARQNPLVVIGGAVLAVVVLRRLLSR